MVLQRVLVVGARVFEAMQAVFGESGFGNVGESLVREVVGRDLPVGHGIEAAVAAEGIVVGTVGPVGRWL